MFMTKKVAKYRCNGLKFALFFAFQFLGRAGQGPLAPPPAQTEIKR